MKPYSLREIRLPEEMQLTVNVQFGKRVRYLRKCRKWSQEELAFESGISKNYLCDLENGRRNPTLELLNRLALAFDLPLQELFRGIDGKNPVD